MTLRIDRFLNFVYAWIAERIPNDRREEWVMQLDMPLPWEQGREPTDAEIERDFEGWGALMAQGRR